MIVVLNDWIGYDLFREREVGFYKIKCGLGEICQRMEKYRAGKDFEVHIVINIGSVFDIHKPDWSARKSKFKEFVLRRSKSGFFRVRAQKKRYAELQEKFSFIKSISYRGNICMDIGAYDFAYQRLKSAGYNGDVVFMNTTLSGPHADNWLLDYQRLFYSRENIGFAGVSLNSHNTLKSEQTFMPHVQSFFLYTSMQVLNQAFPQQLIVPEKVKNRHNLITQGEVGLSQHLINQGYGLISKAYPDFAYFKEADWTIPVGDIRHKEGFAEFANRI